jgi:PAS domain S-box-containing protein
MEDALSALLMFRSLQHSEAKLEEAQRIAHVGHWERDLDTDLIAWSNETYCIYGLPPRKHIPGLSQLANLLHPEDRQKMIQAVADAANGVQPYNVEYRIIRPSGEVRFVHSRGDVVKDESGRPRRMFGTVQDITERRRSEEALRRSENYLAEAQRLSHTGSWARKLATGEITYWSEECYRVLGFEPDDGLPQFETFLQRVFPEDQDKVRKGAGTAARERAEFELDYRIVHPGGQIRDIRAVGHPVFSPSGELVEYVGTVIDVTEQKRAQVLLAGENRLLEMITKGDARAIILEAICRLVEELSNGSLSSILLLDPKDNQLRHGAAPSLPAAYVEAINGLAIGPVVGSCGTAAYRAEPVIVSDIATDPLWSGLPRTCPGTRAASLLVHTDTLLGREGVRDPCDL